MIALENQRTVNIESYTTILYYLPEVFAHSSLRRPRGRLSDLILLNEEIWE
jgi:hypothetical protein